MENITDMYTNIISVLSYLHKDDIYDIVDVFLHILEINDDTIKNDLAIFYHRLFTDILQRTDILSAISALENNNSISIVADKLISFVNMNDIYDIINKISDSNLVYDACDNSVKYPHMNDFINLIKLTQNVITSDNIGNLFNEISPLIQKCQTLLQSYILPEAVTNKLIYLYINIDSINSDDDYEGDLDTSLYLIENFDNKNVTIHNLLRAFKYISDTYNILFGVDSDFMIMFNNTIRNEYMHDKFNGITKSEKHNQLLLDIQNKVILPMIQKI